MRVPSAVPLAAVLLLFLSAAHAEDEIHVEREDDAVVVRSPIAQGNFLFRAPRGFREADPPEGFRLALAADAGRILLRLTRPGAVDPAAFLKDRAKEYGGTAEAAGRGRWIARSRSDSGARTVLLVLDGTCAYELFLESPEPEALDAVAKGFTVLDPKGPPGGAPVAAATAEAEEFEKEFYRLKLLKPEGFSVEAVDPNVDPGIVFRFRRVGEAGTITDIHVRVFLKKTLKEDVAERARKAIESFASRYPPVKGPKRPSKARFASAREAYRFKLAGRATTGALIEEEWLLVEHENDRVYEIQMTHWAGATRAFRKEIAAFWKRLEISD
jgi:hypothetical protein